VKTFPIKKRINTELFIHGEITLLYKSEGGIGSRNNGPLGRGLNIGGK